jgi:hypothetical protein
VLHDEELYDHEALAKGNNPEGNMRGKAAMPFPGEEVLMSINRGPIPHESRRRLKLTSRVVNVVSPAALEHLQWSESPITFDWTNHLDSVPKLERFLHIVDPLVGTT